MIVMSEGLLPNSKYVKMGHEEVGFTPIYSNSLPSSTPDSLMPLPPPPPPTQLREFWDTRISS